MRVLFLDFDGVLHPGPDVVSPLPHWCWLPELKKLLAGHADVGIVVHSSWRHEYVLTELQLLLQGLEGQVVDCTPPGGRLESIEAWVEQNPTVSSYRILDDSESDFFYPLPKELILCDPARGFSGRSAQSELVAWLEATRPASRV